jgi:uncharacterized protein YceH (UPF0502 family)
MDLIGATEARVLGALIEKEATTPEYYPLSLNALLNACNQKSNRNPVVDYDEDTVSSAIERLRHQRFAAVIVGGGRVQKYAQRISETLNLGRRELAVLGVLLLRGPQTLGEIKDRAERSHSFADLEETERVLEKMAEWPAAPLVAKLPRQPGQKEIRYAHLLCGPVLYAPGDTAAPPESLAAPAPGSRVAHLEAEVAALKTEVAELRRRLDNLESQLT